VSPGVEKWAETETFINVVQVVVAPGRNFPVLCFEQLTSLSIFCAEPGRNVILCSEPLAKTALGKLGRSAAEPTSLGAGRVQKRRLARVRQREGSELMLSEYLDCFSPR
jgi:hypothetical protein